MEKIKEDLSVAALKKSEITYGNPLDIEKSFYSQRLQGIDAAYIYLSNKLSHEIEKRNTALPMRFAWGFLLGMLFGLLMLHGKDLPKIIQEILH